MSQIAFDDYGMFEIPAGHGILSLIAAGGSNPPPGPYNPYAHAVREFVENPAAINASCSSGSGAHIEINGFCQP